MASRFVPSRKATLVTLPPVSEAVADSERLTGAAEARLFPGLVRLTVGAAWSGPALTEPAPPAQRLPAVPSKTTANKPARVGTNFFTIAP